MSILEYAEYLVKSISKEPDLIKVEQFPSEEETVLEIMVPETQMGAIIGKGGKVANSLRVLIQAYAYLHDSGKIRINIESF